MSLYHSSKPLVCFFGFVLYMHNLVLVSELGSPFFGSVSLRISPYFPYPKDPFLCIFLSKIMTFPQSSSFPHFHTTRPYFGQSGKRKKGEYWGSPCFGLNLCVHRLDMLRLSHHCDDIWRCSFGKLLGLVGGVLNGVSALKRHRGMTTLLFAM